MPPPLFQLIWPTRFERVPIPHPAGYTGDSVVAIWRGNSRGWAFRGIHQTSGGDRAKPPLQEWLEAQTREYVRDGNVVCRTLQATVNRRKGATANKARADETRARVWAETERLAALNLGSGLAGVVAKNTCVSAARVRQIWRDGTREFKG
jgi:hypothetical protein